jgi:CRP-like cAMP-binding protein
LDQLLTSLAGTASGADAPAALGADSRGQRRAGDGKQWPEVADLRIELAKDAPPLARLGRPLHARVIEFMRGKANLNLIDVAGASFGLIVLDGLLLVELASGRAQIGWLVGASDLVRPSGFRELALTEQSHWRALTDSRVAVLDREFLLRAGGVPLLSRVLVVRATRTANWLLAKALIASSPRIEERLLLMFALFAERWGRVTPDGVALTLPLTHANLASLCGARRPSVTMALHALEHQGWLSCPAKGTWLLRRLDADGGSHHSCFADYQRALGLGVLDLAPGQAASSPPSP